MSNRSYLNQKNRMKFSSALDIFWLCLGPFWLSMFFFFLQNVAIIYFKGRLTKRVIETGGEAEKRERLISPSSDPLPEWPQVWGLQQFKTRCLELCWVSHMRLMVNNRTSHSGIPRYFTRELDQKSNIWELNWSSTVGYWHKRQQVHILHCNASCCF